MKFQRSTAWTSVFCLVIAGGVSRAVAAPPGERLIDKVVKAYQDIQQYDATLRIDISQPQDRWTITRTGEYRVKFDRPANRLLIDTPDQLAVADGQSFYYANPRLPGKHLKIDTTSPVTCEWIVQQVPFMAFPSISPDVAFLISNDPLGFMSAGAAGDPATLPPDPDDPQKRPRIQSALQAGTLTLTIDPKTHLIDKAGISVDAAALGSPGMTLTYNFDIHINSIDQPIDPDRFAFDATGSKASASMQHMLASGSNAPHPLVGQPTPPLNLPDIAGKNHDIATDDPDAKVIVLDFWATWCGPCVAELPELQTVYDWAKDNGKPVAFYAVNQGETTDQIKAFWSDKGLSIPVLMDQNFTAAQAYQVNGIPHTVIIANGKVQQVHVGYRPGIGEQIKAEIQGLLESGKQ